MLPNPPKAVSLRLTLACILFNLIVAEGLTLTSLSHQLPPAYDLMLDDVNSVSPGLVYGSCTMNRFNKYNHDCTFVMETNSNVGTLDHLRFCNFTRRTHVNSRRLNEYSVVALDENKAVVVGRYEYSVTNDVSILDFSNCELLPVNLKNNGYIGVEGLGSGLFELVHSGLRTVLDFNGNIVREPRRDRIRVGHKLAIKSPLKGHLVADTRLILSLDTRSNYIRFIQIYTIEDKGKTNLVKFYSLDNEDFSEDRFPISSTHQLLSVCLGSNLTIVCGQYDLNGKKKFETSLTVIESLDKYFIKAYNLREGGLLLLLFKCNYWDDELCIKQHENYFIVKKIDENGRLAGSLQISQFPSMTKSEVDRMHFFENEKDEMCLSVVFSRDIREKGQVTLSVVCFKDDEFVP